MNPTNDLPPLPEFLSSNNCINSFVESNDDQIRQAFREYAKKAVDAEREAWLPLLKKAREGLSAGLWDYGPGQDEHDQCNALIAEIDAAIAKHKELKNDTGAN